ncbi:hypothetical protein [Nocardioides alpinus]|nr:hypothetical protein [Nocardioides alpinus]
MSEPGNSRADLAEALHAVGSARMIVPFQRPLINSTARWKIGQ